MNIQAEVTNYSVMLIPILVACLAVFFPGKTPQRRLISVVVPALGSILAVGFGLQGLTRACFDTSVLCPEGIQAVSQLGNTFGNQLDCSVCSHTIPSLTLWMNQNRPLFVIGCAIAGSQLSALSLVMFVRWMRRTEKLVK